MIFLRPWILILWIVPFLMKGQKKSRVFEKICDADLLPFLLVDSGKQRKGLFRYLTLLWSVAVLAAAGPCFDKMPVPSGKVSENIVIVADLSPSMQEEEKLRLKLYDVLDYLKGKSVGLVLYDGEGYPIVPLSEDTALIRNTIPVLRKNIMPSNHESRPEKALAEAQNLLKSAGAEQGRILLLTGGILHPKEFQKAVRKLDYPLSVMGIMPTDEKPILLPDGQFYTDDKGVPYINKFDKSVFDSSVRYRLADFEGKDIPYLLPDEAPLDADIDETKKIQAWKDVGIYLVWGLALFLLPLFRKGMIGIILLCFWSGIASANPFLRPDQQAFFLRRDAEDLYRQGKYGEALKKWDSLGNQKNAEDFYNMGNASAFMQKIPEAVSLYEEALKQNPSHQDASENKSYLEKQMPSQQSNAGNSSEKQKKSDDKGDDKSEKSDKEKSDHPSEQNKSFEPQQENREQENREEKNQQSDSKETGDKSSEQNESENQPSEENQSSDKEEESSESREENSDESGSDESGSDESGDENSSEDKSSSSENESDKEEQEDMSEDKSAESRSNVQIDSIADMSDEKPNASMPSEEEKMPLNMASSEKREWMSEVPNDPTLLLKARLKKQYKRKYRYD